MSVYSVGTSQTGRRTWWINWQMAGHPTGYTNIRDATPDEAALMEKVEWQRETPEDCERLRELIQRT